VSDRVRWFRAGVDVRTVSKTLDTVPERTTDCAHAESTTEIVQGPIDDRVSRLAGCGEADNGRTPKGKGLCCDP